jgi:hypothetical protein
MNFPDFITDMQLIDIISKAEGWSHEETYKVAHKEVGVEGYPWDRFNQSMETKGGGTLPTPVRLELIRAFEIHDNAGTLKARHFTSVGKVSNQEHNPFANFTSSKFIKWAMWFWIFYFIIVFFL